MIYAFTALEFTIYQSYLEIVVKAIMQSYMHDRNIKPHKECCAEHIGQDTQKTRR